MTVQSRVLANSLPRGGPFLLATALDLLGYRRFAGTADTPRALNYQDAKNALAKEPPVADPSTEFTLRNEGLRASNSTTIGVSPFAPLSASPATVRRWLTQVTIGEYIMGHMPWSAPLQDILTDLNYRHVVIVRDPRALLLALVFHAEVMPRFLATDFAPMSPLHQVEKMWNGGTLEQAGLTLQPFATVYRSLLAWRDLPNTILIRFEDLVPQQFGGSIAQQNQVLAQLAEFLNQDIALPTQDNQITDATANTFSLSQRATWANQVGAQAVGYVEQQCASLAQDAGYD
jgi:hypothetical protein